MSSVLRQRGQVSLEYLVLTAGLLGVYSIVLPGLLSSFQNGQYNFNDAVQKSIASQVAATAKEVNLLGEGSELQSNFTSPVDFEIVFGNQQVITGNYSFGAPVVDGNAQVKKGRNGFTFLKTDAGVKIEVVQIIAIR